jgi:hypothetical protein
LHYYYYKKNFQRSSVCDPAKYISHPRVVIFNTTHKTDSPANYVSHPSLVIYCYFQHYPQNWFPSKMCLTSKFSHLLLFSTLPIKLILKLGLQIVTNLDFFIVFIIKLIQGSCGGEALGEAVYISGSQQSSSVFPGYYCCTSSNISSAGPHTEHRWRWSNGGKPESYSKLDESIYLLCCWM